MNGEKSSANSAPEQGPTLSKEASAKLGESAAQISREEKRIEAAREDVEYFSQLYRDVTSDFAREKKRKGRIGYDEYLKWEEDAAQSFSKMKAAEYDAKYDNIYDLDAAERLSVNDGENSIEAYAGNFFDERRNLLMEAIDKNTNRAEAAKDILTLGGLHQLVAEYVNARADHELSRTDSKAYRDKRQDAHNRVIDRINELNELAEKYGVTRLTFRNFVGNARGPYSEGQYDRRKDYRGYSNGRAEYDRSVVETYIWLAFTRDFKDFDEEEKKGRSDSIVAMFHTKD